MLHIDRYIRIPPMTPMDRMRGRPTNYPFALLRIGDSFFAPGKSLNWRIDRWSRNTGWRFVKKEWQEDGMIGVRVWRVA